MRETNNSDKLFKFILKAMRNHYKPDLHTFIISIIGGNAYVECRQHEVYIETRTYDINGNETKTEWCGSAIAAANRLEKLGADYMSIDM